MCGQNRPPIAVTLALLMVLCAAGGASLVHAQQNDSYRTVARPTLASGPLCAEEKAALVSSAAAAQAAAAEQQVPGSTEGIRYQDGRGQWHDETAQGNDRPVAKVVED